MTVKTDTRKKRGATRLLNSMRDHVRDANDREICRKLELLAASTEADIPQRAIQSILDQPASFDPDRIAEPYRNYVRHYLYMVRRK